MKPLKPLLAPLFSAFLLTSVALAQGPKPAVPRRAPEFVLNMPDGSTKLLSSYRGKVLMVEFIHTTCPHCQNASRVFSKLYAEYGSKGFQPIGVAWNDMAKMLVPDFIKQFQVSYPIAYSDRDKVLEYLQFSPMMRVVVPQIMWIDRKGMIRSQTSADSLPEEEKMRQEPYWREMIQTLTAESNTSSAKPLAPAKKVAK